MASGFFAILDDIAALMDDVALTAKIATRKTAGILGDDLAVNAEKATGFVSSRELPVLWSITKGSFVNKIIIVPIALLLNAYFPAAITVILVCGGFYLAFEGVEKIVEFLFHKPGKAHDAAKAQPAPLVEKAPPAAPGVKQDDTAAEKAKIKSAVTTDFILSVEIVIIALGTVVAESLMLQIATVSIVALLATVGVYGIVALIVRMDDTGLKLIARTDDKGFFATLGHLLVKALPVIIRILSVVGTIALILVAGGIFVHNIHFIHDLFPTVPAMIKEFGFGLVAGLLAVGLFTIAKKVIALAKQ